MSDIPAWYGGRTDGASWATRSGRRLRAEPPAVERRPGRL